jgi:hypothetical protein
MLKARTQRFFYLDDIGIGYEPYTVNVEIIFDSLRMHLT